MKFIYLLLFFFISFNSLGQISSPKIQKLCKGVCFTPNRFVLGPEIPIISHTYNAKLAYSPKLGSILKIKLFNLTKKNLNQIVSSGKVVKINKNEYIFSSGEIIIKNIPIKAKKIPYIEYEFVIDSDFLQKNKDYHPLPGESDFFNVEQFTDNFLVKGRGGEACIDICLPPEPLPKLTPCISNQDIIYFNNGFILPNELTSIKKTMLFTGKIGGINKNIFSDSSPLVNSAINSNIYSIFGSDENISSGDCSNTTTIDMDCNTPQFTCTNCCNETFIFSSNSRANSFRDLWTDGIDCLKIENSGFIEIPIVVKYSNDYQSNVNQTDSDVVRDIETDISNTNDELRKSLFGIQLVLVSEIAKLSTLDINCGQSIEPNKLTIYYVTYDNDDYGQYGYTCNSSGNSQLILINSTKNSTTLVHEIGHTLGLRHSSIYTPNITDELNIMNNESITRDGFTIGQAFRANFGRSSLISRQNLNLEIFRRDFKLDSNHIECGNASFYSPAINQN